MAKFVLHQHNALRKGLHFDLRFEIPNSKNWASFVFNQFPPTEPGKRVYTPRAPDHTKENALFVGKIPEGEYGAGTIKEVDKGNCEIIKYTNAHIVIDFKGKKLKGIYHFVNTSVFSRSKNYSKKVYAFFKGKIQQTLKEQQNFSYFEKIENSFQKCWQTRLKNGKITRKKCDILYQKNINNQNLKNKFSSIDDFEEYVGYSYDKCCIKQDISSRKAYLYCLKISFPKCKNDDQCLQALNAELNNCVHDLNEYKKQLDFLNKDYQQYLIRRKRMKENPQSNGYHPLDPYKTGSESRNFLDKCRRNSFAQSDKSKNACKKELIKMKKNQILRSKLSKDDFDNYIFLQNDLCDSRASLIQREIELKCYEIFIKYCKRKEDFEHAKQLIDESKKTIQMYKEDIESILEELGGLNQKIKWSK